MNKVATSFGIRAFIGGLLLVVNTAFAAIPATLYKSPDCTCCAQYVEYLKKNGFDVTVVSGLEMKAVRQRFGTEALASCHTMIVDGYVVEGHVPVAAIRKLLKARPRIAGIAVPGMPGNAPGMGPETAGTLKVVAIERNVLGAPRVFSIE